jgi:hypothetical protein
MTRTRSLALLLLPALTLACKGDDGGGGGGSSVALGPLLTIDEALVVESITLIGDAVPACTPTGGGDTAAPTSPPPPAGVSSDGSCGGQLLVDYEHGDGDTDYTAMFLDFCLSSDTGNVVLNGVVVGEEDGTPSDYGPVIEALDIRTDGPLSVAQETGPDYELTVAGLHVEYGVPAEWQPGTPTEAAPDVITLQQMTFSSPDGAYETVTIADIRAERTGTLPTISVLDGAVVLGERGHVRVSTPTPLVIDLSAPGGGARIDYTGADDTIAEGASVSGAPGTLTVTVNGTELDQGLDCGPAVPLLLQAFGPVWQALPLY